MRRLPAVRTAGIDVVVWPDWDVEFLLLVSIEVAEKKTVGPVCVAEPAFECAGNARARITARFALESLARDGRRAHDDGDRDHHCRAQRNGSNAIGSHCGFEVGRTGLCFAAHSA